jgi:hypothetical protein
LFGCSERKENKSNVLNCMLMLFDFKYVKN